MPGFPFAPSLQQPTKKPCSSARAGGASRPRWWPAGSRPGRAAAASRSACTRTCCATRSPPTCCSPRRTCARCRKCSGTRASPPRRSTRTSTSRRSPRSTMPRTRAPRSAEPTLVLKPGRERSLRRRHPWVFSGAVERVLGAPQPGDTVRIQDASGNVVALAAYSPTSQIRARVWTFDAREVIGEPFFRARLERALRLRGTLEAARHTNALRLVHGESDGMPGLVVDRYADVLVAQFLATGVERWREAILDLLVELTGCEAVYERSDAEVRNLEGLQPKIGFAKGNK